MNTSSSFALGAESSDRRSQRRSRRRRLSARAPTPDASAPLDRWLAIGLSLAALALYFATLCPVACPGAGSARAIVQHSGLDPFPSFAHPLYSLLAHALSALPWGSLALKLNALNAVLGAAIVGAFFALIRRLPHPANSFGYLAHGLDNTIAAALPMDRRNPMTGPAREAAPRLPDLEPRARRWAGLVAAVALATTPPFWIAATRAHPAILDAALALLLTRVTLDYVLHGGRKRVWALSFLTPALALEAPILLPIGVALAIAVLAGIVHHRHFKLRFLLAAAGLAILGFGVWLLAAGVLAAQPVARWLQLGYGGILKELILAQYHLLQASIPAQGWLLVFLGVVAPAGLMGLAAVTRHAYQRTYALVIYLILTPLAAGWLFDLPFMPWPFFRDAPLMVTPSLLAAGWAGYLAGQWMLLLRRGLYRWGEPAALWIIPLPGSLLRAAEETPDIAGLRRGLAALAAGLGVTALGASALLHYAPCNGRVVRPAARWAAQVMEDLQGRPRLITASPCDDLLVLAAHEMRRPLDLIPLRLGGNTAWRRWLAAREPVARLRGLLDAGLEPYLTEWIRTDPRAVETAAVFDRPEIWWALGRHPVPLRTVYLAQVSTNSARLAESARWLLAGRDATLAWRDELRAWPEWLQPWGDWLLRHASRVANDTGVLVEVLGGDNVSAAAAYDLARELYPENLSVLCNRAQMARARGSADAAELERDVRGRLDRLGERFRPDVAAAVFGAIAHPDQLAAWQAGAKLAARESSEGGLPETAAPELPGREAAIAEEDWPVLRERLDDPVEALRAAVERAPTDETLRLTLAYRLCRLGNAAEVDDVVRKIPPYASQRPWGELLMVIALHSAGEADNAWQRAVQLADRNPGFHPAWAYQTWMALKRGDLERLRRGTEALDAWDARPPNVSLILALGRLVAEDIPGARSRLEALREFHPDYEPAYVWLLRLDFLERRRDLAEQHTASLLKRDPGHPLGNQYLASFQADRGEYELSIATLRAAVQRRRTPDLLNDLAWSLHRTGRNEEALRIIEEACGAAPQPSAALRDTQGAILLALGRAAEALKILEEARKLSPDDPQIVEHLEQARARISSGR